MWPISRGAKVSVVGVIVQATVIRVGSARVCSEVDVPPRVWLRLLFGSELKDLKLVIPHPGLAPVTHFSLVYLFELQKFSVAAVGGGKREGGWG